MKKLKKFDSRWGDVKRIKGKVYDVAKEMYINIISKCMANNVNLKNKGEDIDIYTEYEDEIWEQCIEAAVLMIFNYKDVDKAVERLLVDTDDEEFNEIANKF